MFSLFLECKFDAGRSTVQISAGCEGVSSIELNGALIPGAGPHQHCNRVMPALLTCVKIRFSAAFVMSLSSLLTPVIASGNCPRNSAYSGIIPFGWTTALMVLVMAMHSIPEMSLE